MNPLPPLERFDHFMARALHDPQEGYYSRHIHAIGRRGDFTTAPMLDNLLAKAIARWAAQQLKSNHCHHLIEIGPGEGWLARQVLAELPWSLRWRVKLHLVEQSSQLASRQRLQLGRRATWHRSPAEALTACGGSAVIYSNELVDAFPVRRFRLTQDGWQEIFVQIDHATQRRTEVLQTPTDLPDSTVFSTLTDPPGQEVEVHESYQNWLLEWLPLWRSGAMLTIDYGAEVRNLYRRRPRGTIRAYWHQQCLTGPEILKRPGHQDLTADVNFSDLQQWAALPCSLHTLRQFLLDHVPAIPPIHPFISADGVGDAFLALEQRRTAACTHSGTL